MRLKIIACKYTVFIQDCISARKFFFAFLISHFGDKLDTNQTDFFFGKFVPEFIKSVVNLICCRLFEVIVDVEHVIFVHDFIQEVVDIQLSTLINDRFHFIQQFAELNALGKRDIIQSHFTVDGLNNGHFHLRLVGDSAYP